MSPRWNRSLHLRLGAGSVTGWSQAGWPRGRAVARATRDYAANANATGADGAATACSEAMGDVLNELQAMPASPGRQLRVWMSGERVHFDVVTGDYRAVTEKQLQAIATACVDEVLGHRASARVVRWQLQPDMRHLLIAAMDAGDVAAVAQAAAQHRLRLHSLQPAFCSRWNQHAASLPGGTGVFAVVEGGHAEVVFVRSGAITAWSSGRCVAEPASGDRGDVRKSHLDERTDRLLTSLGAGTESVPAFVLAVSAAEADAVAVAPRWTLVRIEEGLA